jgi:hypothetical protein
MKRTVLMTILAMSLTLGSNSAYANGSCFNCRYSSADFSPWQQILTFLPGLFWM